MKYFCIKCVKESDTVENITICENRIENHGFTCEKHDYEKIVNDLPTVKNKHGEVQEFKPSVFGTKDGELIMRGESRLTDGKNIDFKIRKENDIWEFYDEEKDGGAGWIKFDEYYTTSTHESTMSKKIMKENMEHIPQMIDDKLREFNFYAIDPKKGKQKISFTDEDRESMKNSFLDMSEKYPEDIAFIRSVVDCRGIDDKTNQPFVRIGSYRNNSNINLPFKNDSKGLGQLLDSGINYFTIENNPTADDRDFKILPGDQIKDVEFSEESRQEMSEPIEQPKPQMKKEEPFEEVMKLKEKKGLASLVDTNEVNNHLSKKQKEIVEKLKKEGYLFKQPVDESGYDMREVKSKEFTESFKVWKKK